MTKIIPEASLIPGECYLLEDGRKALWLGKEFRYRINENTGGMQNYDGGRPVAILSPALSPEEVEATVKAECGAYGSCYYGPGHPNCNIGLEGRLRRILTCHAVAGGDGEAVRKLQQQLEIEKSRCVGPVEGWKARADAAEKELAEARARIAELERRVKSLDETEVSEQTLWDQLCKSERTIVAQAHEIRELKEARR